MPEDYTLGEMAWDGRTIDSDEGPIRPLGLAMDELGRHLFAGPCFPNQKDRQA
jgi:hypothetical protein